MEDESSDNKMGYYDDINKSYSSENDKSEEKINFKSGVDIENPEEHKLNTDNSSLEKAQEGIYITNEENIIKNDLDQDNLTIQRAFITKADELKVSCEENPNLLDKEEPGENQESKDFIENENCIEKRRLDSSHQSEKNNFEFGSDTDSFMREEKRVKNEFDEQYQSNLLIEEQNNSLIESHGQEEKNKLFKKKFDQDDNQNQKVKSGELDIEIETKQFDEKPVGMGNKFQISEYPEGMEFNEAIEKSLEQESGPLSTRMTSKVFKIKQSALIEFITKIKDADTSDSLFSEFSPILIQLLSDPQPVAQEKSLEAMLIYFDKFEKPGFDPKLLTKTLIDKVIGPGKPQLRKTGLDLLKSIFMKYEKNLVFEALIDSVNNKNQKTICGGIQCIIELLNLFGPKKLDFLKPFFPHIEKAASSTVSQVKTDSLNFYKEAYKFMGEAVKPFLSKLSKAQNDQLEKFFKECPEELSIPKIIDPEDEILVDEQDKKTKSQIDAYELSDPVDLFNKFNESWSDKVLNQQKWLEKKDMLSELLIASSVPKINFSPIPYLNSMFKKLMGDSNIQVVTVTIKIIGNLAKGIRKPFSGSSKLILPFLLPKLKDKKVSDETLVTLENFLYCISLDEISDEIKEGLNDKDKSMKIGIMTWIEKFFEKANKNNDKSLIFMKNIIPIYKKLLDDGSSEVRESTIRGLAHIKYIFTEEVLGKLLDDVIPTKLTKINELYNAFKSGTIKDKNNQPPSSKSSKPNQAQANSIEEKKIDQIDSKKIEAKMLASKPSKIVNKAPENIVDSFPSYKDLISEDIMNTISFEESEAKLKEVGIAEQIFEGLNQDAWKLKQQSIILLSEWVSNNVEIVNETIEFLVRYLKAIMRDWKESNMNVIKEAFQFLQKLATDKSFRLTQKSMYYIIPFIVANINEIKYMDTCRNIILSSLDNVSGNHLMLMIIQIITDPKNPKSSNPKLLVEICSLIAKILESSDTDKQVPIRDLIDFAKTCISNSNGFVRTASISIFKEIYKLIGTKLNDLIRDLNPNAAKTLQSELNFTPNNLKQEKNEDRVTTISAESNGPADISNEITKLMKKLSATDLKSRTEALEAFDILLKNNSYNILPNGMNECISLMKTRINDSNKGQAKNYISFMGRLASSLHQNFKLFAKIILPDLVKLIVDKNAGVKSESISSIDKIGATLGNECIINNMMPLLIQENSELRFEILSWMNKNIDSLPKADLKINTVPVLSALQDKNKEVKIMSCKVLEKSISVIGPDPYINSLREFKPAVQSILKTLIENRGCPDIDGENILDTSTSSIVDLKATLKRNNTETNLLGKSLDRKQIEKKGELSKSSSVDLQSSGMNIEVTAESQKSGIKQIITPNKKEANTTSSTPSNNSNQLIQILGQKQKRQEEDKKYKWPVEELREDLIEKMRDHLKKHLNNDLYTKIVSNDVKKQLEAVMILKRIAISEYNGTIDILDLIFKWLFTKLIDTANTQMMKECLDYIFTLLLSLEANKYMLTETETYILLSLMVEKLSTSHQNFRTVIQKIFQTLSSLCPPQKISNHLVLGLSSKSMKTKTESLEMILNLIKIHGVEIINHKDIKQFAKLTTSNDQNLKNNAINLLCELAELIGESLIKIIGTEAPAKVIELLQQKIKPAGTLTMDKIPDEYRQSNNRSQNSTGAQTAGFNLTLNLAGITPKLNIKEDSRMNFQSNQSNPEIDSSTSFERVKESVVTLQKIDGELFDKTLNLLITGNMNNKLDALFVFNDLLSSANEENKKIMEERAQELFNAIKVLLRNLFQKPKNEVPIKFLKYFINFIYKLTTIKFLMKSLDEECLKGFIEEMFLRLLVEDEEKKNENSDNYSIFKMLDGTTLRILENSDPNTLLKALFDLLIKNRREHTYAKILGLIVKCILKIIRILDQIKEFVNPEIILLKCHMYLKEFTNDAKTMNDDIGIIMIKNILKELCRVFSNEILDIYEKIIAPSENDAYLLKWIQILLKSKDSDKSNNNKTFSSAYPLVLTSKPEQTDLIEFKQAFERIFSTTDFNSEILKLYELIISFPDHSIINYMKSYTENTRDYIIASLERIHSEKYNLSPREKGAKTSVGNQYKIIPVREINENHESQIKAKANTLSEIHDKVSQLKMKYGLVMRGSNQIEPSPQLGNPDSSNYKDFKSNQEFIQKLNDMKSKVASIVESTKNSNL